MPFQLSVHNHDPANVQVTLADGTPPADQSALIAQLEADLAKAQADLAAAQAALTKAQADLTAIQNKLNAYMTATRADAQRIKDRQAPQGNKPNQEYVKATRADAQIIIDRQP